MIFKYSGMFFVCVTIDQPSAMVWLHYILSRAHNARAHLCSHRRCHCEPSRVPVSPPTNLKFSLKSIPPKSQGIAASVTCSKRRLWCDFSSIKPGKQLHVNPETSSCATMHSAQHHSFIAIVSSMRAQVFCASDK